MDLSALTRQGTAAIYRGSKAVQWLARSILGRARSPEALGLEQEASKVEWFHRIDLGHGVISPGQDNSQSKLATFGIPEDLRGWSVLDVGAWDGFFSFEAERRGAAPVLATDYFSWRGGSWGSKEGFELSRRARGSKVQDMMIDVMDISPERTGRFDLVLFLGVLYHMRHPLLSLEKVAAVTNRLLILETHVDMLDCPRPAMAFYPERELYNDPTNWCGPNPPMIEALLKDVGFQKVIMHSGPTFHTRLSPRVVFHAWK
jgi:tRNA (mo5U34)-methyltransferase